MAGFGPASAILVRLKKTAEKKTIDQLRVVARRNTPNTTFVRIQTFSQLLDPEFRSVRLATSLFAVLSLIALFVSSVGVFMAIRYVASQRRKELGIRSALGARRVHLAILVIQDIAGVVTVGALAGIGAGALLSHSFRHLYFGIQGVSATDVVFVFLVLAALGLVAAGRPAISAGNVPPAEALNAD
jgi:ABC-type antimicrobial peptide transport system permease subunit